MNLGKDLYAVLGILPSAEDVVVRGAFQGLAKHYHPDRWKGDIAEATDRMAEINRAYGVLGDARKRKDYDASINKRMINADAKLLNVLRKSKSSAYEMVGLIAKHLR